MAESSCTNRVSKLNCCVSGLLRLTFATCGGSLLISSRCLRNLSHNLRNSVLRLYFKQNWKACKNCQAIIIPIEKNSFYTWMKHQIWYKKFHKCFMHLLCVQTTYKRLSLEVYTSEPELTSIQTYLYKYTYNTHILCMQVHTGKLPLSTK